MVIIDLKVFNSNNFLDCCLLEITNTVLPNLQSQTQHFLFLSLRLLLDSIIHVYNAIWPYSLLKFKNFKSRLNRTWRSIRNECLLSWPKQTGELDTRISFPTEGQREKQNPRKDWRRNKRSLGRDVAPPPSVLRLLSIPGGGHSMMWVPLCTSLLTFLTLAGLLCPVYWLHLP